MTLEALFRGELLDALEAAGFERVRRKTMAVRFHDGILQWVMAGKQTPGFSIDFAVQPLWVPEQHLVAQPGCSIASATSPFGAPGAAHVDQPAYLRGEPSIPGARPGYLWALDPKAIPPIVRALRRTVLPWLDAARDAAGLLALLAREQWKSHHHQNFMRAAACARLDRLDDARAALSAAIAGYQEDLAARPGAIWCSERIERCRELAAALEGGGQLALLEGWAEATRAALLAE